MSGFLTRTKELEDSLDLILLMGSLGLEDYVQDVYRCTLAQAHDVDIYNGLKRVDKYSGDVIILRMTYRTDKFDEIEKVFENNPHYIDKNMFGAHASFQFKMVNI